MARVATNMGPKGSGHRRGPVLCELVQSTSAPSHRGPSPQLTIAKRTSASPLISATIAQPRFVRPWGCTWPFVEEFQKTRKTS